MSSRPLRLVHVTTIPGTLMFLSGQPRYLRQRGFEVMTISSPGPALEQFEQAEEVERDRGVIDVPDVEAKPLPERKCVAAMHHGPAREPWTHVVATALLGRVHAQVLREQRARSNEAHVAAQDVPQLGQLVEARGPEEPPEACDPLPITLEPDLAWPWGAHRPELHERERPLVPPDPDLPEEDWPPRRDEDCQRDEEQQRRQPDQASRRDRHIQRPVERALGSSLDTPPSH